MIVVCKEGLTSKELVSHAKELDYLKSKIVNTALTFTNVREPFSAQLFEKTFEDATVYSLQAASELDALV
jgi:hypothetical protein